MEVQLAVQPESPEAKRGGDAASIGSPRCLGVDAKGWLFLTPPVSLEMGWRRGYRLHLAGEAGVARDHSDKVAS